MYFVIQMLFLTLSKTRRQMIKILLNSPELEGGPCLYAVAPCPPTELKREHCPQRMSGPKAKIKRIKSCQQSLLR